MREDDLAALLRSPALGLEPPRDLLEGVQAGARTVRRRQAAGTVALSVVAVLVAVLVGPGLLGGGADEPDERVVQPASPFAERFPLATSSFELLENLNDGEVVTWFQGRRWCTAAIRVRTAEGCSGALGATVPPFAFLRLPGHETLTVDRDTLVAGVLGTGVEEVRVVLSDGSSPVVSAVSGRGFPRPVWWTAVPPGTSLRSVTAHDEAGGVVGSYPG